MWILASLVILAGYTASAQVNQKKAEVKIQTSAQCEMCKSRIESALAYESGIIRSTLDMETKILTVKYRPSKLTVTDIKKKVAAIGYDADEIPADEEAYQALPTCCKKPDDPAHENH
jgi:copper chaperone CopZ